MSIKKTLLLTIATISVSYLLSNNNAMCYDESWDFSSPSGTTDANTLDTEITDFKKGIAERLNNDHWFTEDNTEMDDLTAGDHRQVTMLWKTAAPTEETDTGIVYVYKDGSDAELCYEDNNSNDVQITKDGALNYANPTAFTNISIAGNATISNSLSVTNDLVVNDDAVIDGDLSVNGFFKGKIINYESSTLTGGSATATTSYADTGLTAVSLSSTTAPRMIFINFGGTGYNTTNGGGLYFAPYWSSAAQTTFEESASTVGNMSSDLVSANGFAIIGPTTSAYTIDVYFKSMPTTNGTSTCTAAFLKVWEEQYNE